MRKVIVVLLVVALTVCLASCGSADTPQMSIAETTKATIPSTTTPAVQHSELYLKGVFAKQMVRYFNEVVLGAEYTENAAQAKLVQKWTEPIYYEIEGAATDEDVAVLNKLFGQLNEIKGFPGIQAAGGENQANLTMSFLGAADFQTRFAGVVQGEDAYGAAQFWYYNESNEIYKGRIGYRTDITQNERNSILLEEIVNVLGLSDTEKRTDSIVYQHSNEALEPSREDWVILKLLYHPLVECGMDAAACKILIEQLYY